MKRFDEARSPREDLLPGKSWEGLAMQTQCHPESPIAVRCLDSPSETTTTSASGGALPARRRLTTLFVDIAGSTSLLVHHPPEAVLGVVQCFMRLVTDVAYASSGNVKDYEGDGALLYFDATRDAVRAALEIRAELAAGRCNSTCGGGPGIVARMSVTVGEVVVGVVGSSMRHAVALIGPSVNIGARLLKQIPEGGIIASGEVVEALHAEAPALAAEFRLLDHAFEVPGGDGVRVSTYEVRTREAQ
jgi:class 3 adenylate cyclase